MQADSMIFRLSTIYEVGKLFFLASTVFKSPLTLRLGSFPHMNQLHGHGIVNSSDGRFQAQWVINLKLKQLHDTKNLRQP